MSKGNGRIAIVDDDESICDILSASLSRQGFDPVAFAMPQDALDALSADLEIDAVITDVGMTEMSGFALCERILGMRPGLPVLVLTRVGAHPRGTASAPARGNRQAAQCCGGTQAATQCRRK
jgi:DNA-binding NtrC family response regulator